MRGDDKLWMLGDTNIPEDKCDEFNRYVLDILNRGGVRKKEDVILAGRKITLLNKVEADGKGIVSFDYSVFGYDVSESGIYDMNRCCLEIDGPIYGCFEAVIALVLVLKESYSRGNSNVMSYEWFYKHTDVLLAVLKSMYGKEFYFEHRGRVWEMLTKLAKYRKVTKADVDDVIKESMRNVFVKLDICSVVGVGMLFNRNEPECAESDRITRREEISIAKANAQLVLLCELYKSFGYEREQELENFLEKIIVSGLGERSEWAKREDEFGIIAEISLYMLPQPLLLVYTNIASLSFWEIWEEIGDKAYKDILCCGERLLDSGATKSVPLYRLLRKENEDEFIEFWDGNNLHLSNHLLSAISEWSKKVPSMNDIAVEEVEEYLAEVVEDLYNDCYVGLVDRAFVDAILENKEMERARKTLVLLRSLMDKDVKLFPELTRRHAIDYIIKLYRSDEERIELMAFVRLITNPEQRSRVFGF